MAIYLIFLGGTGLLDAILVVLSIRACCFLQAAARSAAIYLLVGCQLAAQAEHAQQRRCRAIPSVLPADYQHLAEQRQSEVLTIQPWHTETASVT